MMEVSKKSRSVDSEAETIVSETVNCVVGSQEPTTLPSGSDGESKSLDFCSSQIMEQQPRDFSTPLERLDREIFRLRREIAEEKALADIQNYILQTASDGSVPDDERTIIDAKSFLFDTPDLMRVALCEDADKPLQCDLESIKSALFRRRAASRRYPLNPWLEEMDKRIADADPQTNFWIALDARLEELSKYLPSDYLPITDFYRYRPRIPHEYTLISEASKSAQTYAAQQRKESLFLHGIPNALMSEEMKIWDSLVSVISQYPAAIAGRNLLKKLLILHLVNDLQYSFRVACLAEYDARLRISGLKSHF